MRTALLVALAAALVAVGQAGGPSAARPRQAGQPQSSPTEVCGSMRGTLGSWRGHTVVPAMCTAATALFRGRSGSAWGMRVLGTGPQAQSPAILAPLEPPFLPSRPLRATVVPLACHPTTCRARRGCTAAHVHPHAASSTTQTTLLQVIVQFHPGFNPATEIPALMDGAKLSRKLRTSATDGDLVLVELPKGQSVAAAKGAFDKGKDPDGRGSVRYVEENFKVSKVGGGCFMGALPGCFWVHSGQVGGRCFWLLSGRGATGGGTAAEASRAQPSLPPAHLLQTSSGRHMASISFGCSFTLLRCWPGCRSPKQPSPPCPHPCRWPPLTILTCGAAPCGA